MVRKKISTEKRQDLFWGYFFIFPTILGLFTLNIWPIIETFRLSFFRSIGFGDYKFVGLENFQKLLSDSGVWRALANTLLYAIYTVPTAIIISLIVAVLLNAKIKGQGVYRTSFFFPIIIPPTAIAIIWKLILNQEHGLLNSIFSTNIGWLTTSNTALISIAIVGIWSSIGSQVIIFLAGLQDIPETYFEAAKIDGANPYQQMTRIIIPSLTKTILFLTVTQMISALLIFDLIFIMIAERNPIYNSTQSMITLFYRYAFTTNEKGYASAIIMVLLLVIVVITFGQLKLQKRFEDET